MGKISYFFNGMCIVTFYNCLGIIMQAELHFRPIERERVTIKINQMERDHKPQSHLN